MFPRGRGCCREGHAGPSRWANGRWDPNPGSLSRWHSSTRASVRRPACPAEAVPHQSTGAAVGGAPMATHPASVLAPSCAPRGQRGTAHPPCAAHSHSHTQNLLLLPFAEGQSCLLGPGHRFWEGQRAAGRGGSFQRWMCQHSSKLNSSCGACAVGSCWRL